MIHPYAVEGSAVVGSAVLQARAARNAARKTKAFQPGMLLVSRGLHFCPASTAVVLLHSFAILKILEF